MSNFPNMQYCMFENTSNAMDQIADAIQVAIDDQALLNLNRYEDRPFNEMWEKCRSLMTLLEQYEEMKDELREADSQEEDDAIDEA